MGIETEPQRGPRAGDVIRRQRVLARWLCLLLLALGSWLHAAPAAASSCGAATTRGTAPADFQHYCWLDFSGYSDSLARNGGQPYSFTLPDGSTLTLTLTVQGTANALVAASSPSWSGAAFGNSAFLGIPGRPVLYQQQSGATNVVTLSNIKVTAPGGAGAGQTSYSIIAADGESTNTGESLSFTTNGEAWKQLAQVANGSYFPTVTGVGTTTVVESGTKGGSAGSFVFGSFKNPTQVSANVVGSGLQGVVFAVRFASISVTTVINGHRVSASDQFTYGIKSSTGAVISTQTSSGTGLGPFTLAVAPNISASYALVINEVMASGSASNLGNYNESLTCTNTASSTTVVPTNYNGTSYTLPSVQYGDDIGCVFTNTPYPDITGSIYNDLNHNRHVDPGEGALGAGNLYVKLATLSGGVCQSPALLAVPVVAATGFYSVPGVAAGSYCLILDGNSTLSDVTPGRPAGWIGTEADTGIRQLTLSSSVPATQNFGLFKGASLSGYVFTDSGIGSGTANNGVQDGGETGIAAITVNATVGNAAVDSALADGSGAYTLWIPATASGTIVIAPVAPTGYLATGGSAGNSGGSYTRPSVSLVPASGLVASHVDFGLVPANTFAPDGAQTAPPGTVVFYPHRFVATSGGSVTFGSSATAAPVISGWSETIYRDVDCNGQLDTGDLLLTAPAIVSAGQSVCVLIKEFVPASAPLNAQNKVEVRADFTYTQASPALAASFTRTDVTTVSLAGGVKLSKLVNNLTQGDSAGTSNHAVPGDSLRYQLTVSNPGSAAVSQLVVTDATPAFTAFVSAACPTVAALPAGLTGCTVASQPAVGAQGTVSWTFTGSLPSGRNVVVSYQVTVSP